MLKRNNAVKVLCALTLLTALMLHANWNAPFYKFDDPVHIRFAMKRGLRAAFTPDVNAPFVPLATLSYRLDYALFGPTPLEEVKFPASTMKLPENWDRWAPAVRIMNGVYHVAAGFLLWIFLMRLGAGQGIAVFVALAWTGHPMACESVCWISERRTVLSALFGFASLAAATADGERRPKWRWPLVWFLYTLALASKPSAIGLAPLLAALELFDWRKELRVPVKREWLNAAIFGLVLGAISFLYARMTLTGFSLELIDPPGGSIWTALLTDTEIFARYLYHVFAPWDLSFFYGVMPIASLSDPRVWIHGLILIGSFSACYFAAARESRRFVLLGGLWFFGALGPAANIVSIAYWMQDRYAYLAAPGALLAGSLAISGLLARVPLPRRALAVACVLLLAAMAAIRAPLFRDSELLEIDASHRQPLSGFAHGRAARILSERMRLHLPDGSSPNAEEAGKLAAEAVADLRLAASCPDIQNFSDPFTLKVMEAEILVATNHFEEAHKVLQAWLPPPNLKLLPETDAAGHAILYSRRERCRGYTASSLGHAWNLLAESDLRAAAMLPGNLLKERLALCDLALSECDSSARAFAGDYDSRILKARILMVRATALEEANDDAAAQREFDAALLILKSVPESSANYPKAQFGLKSPRPHR